MGTIFGRVVRDTDTGLCVRCDQLTCECEYTGLPDEACLANLPIFTRTWAMPSADTLSIKPIRQLVFKYLGNHKRPATSVDPFARNCNLCGFTNDINPNTIADYHMDAKDFLEEMAREGYRFDTCIFDPPFSPRQIKECYNAIGKKMEQMDAFRTHWKPERDALDKCMNIGGHVISFGWNTIGMGVNRGYLPVEVLDVVHGPGHNDTLVIVERKEARRCGELW